MPRYDKQSIGGSPLQGTQGPREGLGIAASPVDLGVRRQGGADAMALADALKGLSPALAAYGDQVSRRKSREDALMGSRARDQQAGVDVMPTLREQTPEFQAGYMRQHGLRMSIMDGEETERLFLAESEKPGFNPDAFFAERRRQGLEGMSDPDAYEGYASQLLRTEARLRSDYTKQVVEQTRANEFTDRATEVAYVQRAIKDRDVQSSTMALDAFMAKHSAKGVSKERLMDQWINAAVNDKEAVPQDFDYLFNPDASGKAPADRQDGNKNPYRVRIENAKAAASAREDAKYAGKMKDAQREGYIALDQTLREDPMSITDPVEYVRQRSHIWESGPAAASAVESILKAQAGAGRRALYAQYINGTAWAPRGLAGSDPMFKAAVEENHYAAWAKVDPSNPSSIANATTESTRLFDKTGVPDPFIASLSTRVKTMGLTKDATGNEVLSPEFQYAYGVYKSLRDTNNEQLSLFDDTSRIMLATFEAAYGTDVEKFRVAQIAIDPKTKGAIRENVWQSPEARRKAVADVAGNLNSLWREGVGIGKSPANASDIAEDVVKYAELLKSRGGNMTMEVALKVAAEKAANSYAWDGHGSMVRIPQSLPKAKATEYASLMVSEARTKLGARADNYVMSVVEQNGKPSMVMRDALGVVDLVPPRSLEQLDFDVRRAKGVTPEQIADKQAVKSEERRAYYLKQYELGQLSPEEFRLQYNALDASEDLARKEKARAAGGAISDAPQLPKANVDDPTLRIPIPQPLGAEVSPKKIALERAKSDPYMALTAAGEGYRNVKFDDPNQRDKLIGFGYNISSRSEKQVRTDLAKAGVTDVERQSRIISGEEAITPDEAGGLANLVKEKSAALAVDVVGKRVWDAMPNNRRAVLIDLAYQAGDNSAAFRSALGNLQKGNEKGVLAALEVSYWKEKDQKRVKDHRRNNLRLAMWESPEKFQELVNRGI